MKRRAFLKQTAAGIAAGTVAAPAIAQAQPQIRWRLAPAAAPAHVAVLRC